MGDIRDGDDIDIPAGDYCSNFSASGKCNYGSPTPKYILVTFREMRLCPSWYLIPNQAFFLEQSPYASCKWYYTDDLFRVCLNYLDYTIEILIIPAYWWCFSGSLFACETTIANGMNFPPGIDCAGPIGGFCDIYTKLRGKPGVGDIVDTMMFTHNFMPQETQFSEDINIVASPNCFRCCRKQADSNVLFQQHKTFL